MQRRLQLLLGIFGGPVQEKHFGVILKKVKFYREAVINVEYPVCVSVFVQLYCAVFLRSYTLSEHETPKLQNVTTFSSSQDAV